MAAYPLYTSTTTASWGTSTATDGTGEIYIDTGTGGQRIRFYNPYTTESKWDVSIDTDTDKISKAVTKKDLKMIKDEVRKYMKDQMLKDAKKVAGSLFSDVEKLKKEKTQLKKEVTELKTLVKKAKADIQLELEKVEEVLERRARSIGKFKYMDFSRDDEI